MQSVQDTQHYLRPGLLQLSALPPLSLYIHLPWCLKKCPYCDFNSHEFRSGNQRESLPEQAYLAALVADLEAALPLVWGRTVHSIFIGGGTPSLFSPESIDELLGSIRARVKLDADCEITLEANPGTFEKNRFKAFRRAGVTRLSVGVQSFQDDYLQALGRVHDRAQAMAAVEEAATSFDTFNLDIMYALPNQTLSNLELDIKMALAVEPKHFSIYHLTIEPNTYFAKFPPKVPEDDIAYAMLDRITEMTADAGLQRYEVSAYAQPGHRCWHNLNYWQFGDYLGIGAGAHSKLSFPHRIVRQERLRDPRLYMDGAAKGFPLASEAEVGRADLAFEFMLNAMRLLDGISLQQFAERTGLPLTSIDGGLAQAEQKGLLTRTLTHVKPTVRGMDFLSDLQTLFLPG
ncbi:MAG: oxygen-independent coproporphyrinogen III oxidase-like protein [Betaproteobacteria bacterium]|jgi:putative oxygen-independent coproporphyrinogen III oxidase|nr:oxygen-independent coproporphyrinogen III oxidase-like protein [Betaproteobacteria bacterium]